MYLNSASQNIFQQFVANRLGLLLAQGWAAEESPTSPAAQGCYAASSLSHPGKTSTAGWHLRAFANILARSTPKLIGSCSRVRRS
ncbi:hypothetical protein [Nitrosomonas sp.]|uniref:hypothetical protein n=1 Tax=Nitrosomonas sp. TaxID=42353 RepID=UPI001E1A1409|nr:hypothetical protein [Nitrosomonas sp.]MBX3615728.1 hypothetical protein [Nitrosomonas sp.]